MLHYLSATLLKPLFRLMFHLRKLDIILHQLIGESLGGPYYFKRKESQYSDTPQA